MSGRKQRFRDQREAVREYVHEFRPDIEIFPDAEIELLRDKLDGYDQ